jgi:hypothetical protein
MRARPRLPAGLLGMVALVAVVESGLATRHLDTTSPATLTWRLSDQAARRGARSARVLVLGESLMKHGLLPEVVESQGAGPTVNLAVCAAQAPTSYYLLKHALDAGARPEAVVVGFAPDLLIGDPKYNARNWPELLDPLDGLELARASRSADLLAGTALGWLLPSYRCRFEIRPWIAAALRGEGASPRAINELYTHHWTRHRGGQLTPVNPAFHGEVSDAEAATLLADRFWCNRINRRYIERLLRLAESRDIRVYWLIPPVSPALQARRDATGADAKYDAFVRRVQTAHPRLVVLDGRHSGYDWPVFQDARHLVADGTIALSADVGEIVAHGEPPSGWVHLPEFRPRPHDDRLEDVNRSRIVLRERARRR